MRWERISTYCRRLLGGGAVCTRHDQVWACWLSDGETIKVSTDRHTFELHVDVFDAARALERAAQAHER